MFVLSGVSPLPEQFRFDVGKYTTGYETTTTTKGHSSTAPTSNNDSKSYNMALAAVILSVISIIEYMML
jgi:hypothetical protein